jgi:hypothetical protein
VAGMLVVLQVCLMLLSFTSMKSAAVTQWLYVPSLVIAWAGYAYYERVYIPRNCPGDCAIRVDLLFIYPYLAFVTIAAIVYLMREGKPARPRRRG